MIREGIENVSQLNGGIENYGQDEETRGDLWEGKMYVFDDRISVPINHVDRQSLVKTTSTVLHVNVT